MPAAKSIEWKYTSKPASKKDLNKIIGKINFTFPKDYLAHINKQDGGMPEPNEHPFGYVLNYMFTFSPDPHLYIGKYINSDHFPKLVVPFANSPGGDFFCFDFRIDANNPPVVYFFHEEAACYEADHGTLEGMDLPIIATSFTDLISQLGEYTQEEVDKNRKEYKKKHQKKKK